MQSHIRNSSVLNTLIILDFVRFIKLLFAGEENEFVCIVNRFNTFAQIYCQSQMKTISNIVI